MIITLKLTKYVILTYMNHITTKNKMLGRLRL